MGTFDGVEKNKSCLPWGLLLFGIIIDISCDLESKKYFNDRFDISVLITASSVLFGTNSILFHTGFASDFIFEKSYYSRK